MAKTIVEGTRGGVSAQPRWTPRWVTVAAVEPRGAAAESPNAGGSAQDGASASGIGKSRWRRREPEATVERRGVAVVQPCGAAAKSLDAGGSARDGASAGHGGRVNRWGWWSAARWRLLNRRMWEDPFEIFRVTIIG
jgi:hypothetical protein